ncbi:DUF2993 domain-containing protein [Nanchangia anserum]|uniref:DUF2993 domain-containing protein n=1 Tax=Nanchangia anserum TaxID=2692125 RepID=A0A8I0GGR8_9ACTO|nr:DUF2993 domain-containing protein [Nanchangia anserum]MBD3689719.1 DUF2993 domain-containing protein [Nanchangia anserum]QOX81893.1 DUF2993 domain-containing protein [Nanchangia anserum]
MTFVRRLLIVVVIVAVLGGIADRAAWWFARDVATSRLADRGVSSPALDIGGFPFLTQVASQRFDDVTVTSPRLVSNGTEIRDLSAHARGVEVSFADRSITSIDSLQLRALIPTDVLTRTIAEHAAREDVTIATETDHLVARVALPGGFTASAPVTLTPAGLSETGYAQVTASFGAVSVDNARVGRLYASRLALPAVTVPLTSLPRHLEITSIAVRSDGLVIDLAGQGVSLTR